MVVPCDNSTKQNSRPRSGPHRPCYWALKRQKLTRIQLLHFLLFKKFLFLHITHGTELMSRPTLTWQISSTLPILDSCDTCYIQVRSLYMRVSRVIKCFSFFNGLFAPYLRHQVQNQSTTRDRLLLCLHYCNPKEHLVLPEFLNSTDQAHVDLAVK